MCIGRTRAEAEDIASRRRASNTTSCRPSSTCWPRPDAGAPLVHEAWDDNVFVEFRRERRHREGRRGAAAIKVTREIRTARHCMLPLEGRGVLAWWAIRACGYLTVVTSTQMPHIVQTGIAECLGLSDGDGPRDLARCRRRLRLQGRCSCREEVALSWLALELGHPVRWIEDMPRASLRQRQLPRAPLSHHRLCRRRRPPARHRLRGAGRCRRLLGLSDSAALEAGRSQPAAGALRFRHLPLPRCRGRHQQVPDPALSRRRPHRRLPRDRGRHGCGGARRRSSSPTRCGCATWCGRSRCRSTTWSRSTSTAATTPSACAARSRRSTWPSVRAAPAAQASRTAG